LVKKFMVEPFKCFENFQNLPVNWLYGIDNRQFQESVEQLYIELIALTTLQTSNTSPQIIIAESEPINFLAAFLAACAAKCQVFLCNPDWGENEWQQVFDLFQPDWIFGKGGKGRGGRQGRQGRILSPLSSHSPLSPYSLLPTPSSPLIMIPTGGSSGQIKFAVHTWETLTASVRGFTEYFQVKQVNSVCVLPCYHVSGLMQFMRAFTTGGKLVILPFKELASGEIPNINSTEFFVSLVPTQLHRLLRNPLLTKWLSQFKTVLLGGAPAWDELLEKVRFYQIPLAPTYGMTETASQIVTLKPNDFLRGKVGCGQVLPHAEILVCDENGDLLPANQVGNIAIKTTSLMLGYYHEYIHNNRFSTINNFKIDDVGYFDKYGYLNIIGRSSDKIITGGENVYPAEIEAAIRETEMVVDVCVIGVVDKDWGQAVTAIYVPKYANTSIFAIKTILKYKLCKFKIPKNWIAITDLPRNSQGKINRQKLQEIVMQCPKS
jgi:o-succinylbenzoate---CoA ligase